MNVNSSTSLLPSYLLPFNSTANTANANSASSVQQQADVHSSSTADQFLTQLQQVQTPQQYQAMISQISGQPQPANTTASAGTTSATPGKTPTAKHCQGGGGHSTASSPSSPISPSRTQGNIQNQSVLANLFGSLNPSQSALLANPS
jgi:hypothetical protein